MWEDFVRHKRMIVVTTPDNSNSEGFCMKRFLAILLVAVLLLCMLPAASMAAKYATVVGGWLRLRAAANFNATTITSYYTGTEVEIISSSGGWYKVRTPDGRTGYMYGQYLNVGSSSTSSSGSAAGNAYVTSHNGYGVRMRTGPGTGYRVIRTYDVGTPVTVLQSGSYWSKISINGTIGYMMSQFLTYGSGSGSSSSDSVICYATIWSRNGYGVRLRRGPSKDYGTIGTYSVGTTVAVLEKGKTWDKIRVGSRVGWMMNEFLDYHNTNEVTSVTLNNYRPAVGTVLSVQAISPAKATVSYEWRVNGTTKGTASTYTVTAADVGYQIQLKVTGVGSYTGSAKSAKTDAVLSNTQLSGLSLNTTAPVVGNKLTATVQPASASVLYAWIVGDSQVSNASSYTVTANDVGKVIKLIVTGTGNYSGSLTLSTTAVTATGTLTGVTIANTTNTASGAVPAVGDVLNAVTSPTQATATYQWMADGADISGATSKSFTLTSAQVGKKISVKAAAAAPYVGGTVTSSATDAVIETPVAPTITTTVLPNGEKDTAYSQTLQVSGTAPITWSITSGSLPAGLSLDAVSGVISGTPTGGGTSSFTVKATNPAMQSATKDLTLVIVDSTPAQPKLEIDPVNITLTEGYTPAPVQIAITNSGNAEAIITALTSQDANFVISAGNTTIGAQQTDKSWTIMPPANVTAGSGTMTLTVTYNDGKTATATLTMTVNAASGGGEETETPTAVAPTISTAGTASATAGVDFALDLAASGTGNLTWTVENLPAGLALNGSTISGKVDVADIYTFTVKVTSDDVNLAEADRVASKSIELTVNAAPNDEMGDENVDDTPPSTYTVTVTGGSGDGSYAPGATVSVALGNVPEGKYFIGWTITGLSDKNSASEQSFDFTMPAGAVTVEAVYGDMYTVTVTGGSGDGSYAPGASVAVSLGSVPEGKYFTGWTISGLSDKTSSSEESFGFTMPSGNVTVEAAYGDLYTVNVTGGSGDGSYAPGASVSVSLGSVPDDKEFDGWTISGLSDKTSSSEESFSFTMPAGNVSVTANYKDKPRTLSTPSGLAWNGDTATWNAVDGAESYLFYSYKQALNDGAGGYTAEKSVGNNTSYTFTGGDLQPGDRFFIKAVGNGVTTLNSDYATSPDHP